MSCHVIKSKSKIQADFMKSFPQSFNSYYYDEEEEVQGTKEPKLIFDPVSLLFLPLFILCFVFLMGLIKAILGLCIRPIGKWGYNYIEPFYNYDQGSKCRQFRINLIFFFIVPYLYCCSKCCGKWQDLSNLTSASDQIEKGHSLKKQFIIKQEKYEEIDNDEEQSDIDSDIPSERTNLLYPFSYNLKKKRNGNKKNRDRRAADVTLQTNTNNHDASNNNNRFRPSAGYSVNFTIDEEQEEEEDTSFVLTALTESRDSMSCLDGPHHNDNNNDDHSSCVSSEINDFIKKLYAAQIVYRIFTNPIGNIDVEKGQKYSIRGFFLPYADKKYKFITNLPLRQHWKLEKNSQNLVPIFPAIVLLSRDFSRIYHNKQDVFESNDLVVKPILSAPVLNMQLQAKHVYDDDITNQICDNTTNNNKNKNGHDAQN